MLVFRMIGGVAPAVQSSSTIKAARAAHRFACAASGCGTVIYRSCRCQL
jgi:hypothetical protein